MQYFDDMITSGLVFNDFIKGQKLYIITDDFDTNNEYNINEYLHMDLVKIDMNIEDNIYYSGGIDIFPENSLIENINYFIDNPVYIYNIEIFDDSCIVIESGIIKCDKFKLIEKKIIGELPIWKDKYECEKIITKFPLLIRFMDNNHEDLQDIFIKAIKIDSRAIQYINNKTYDLCKYAVEISGNNLKYIDEQTEELCLIAVTNYPNAIKYVKKQTDKIALQTVKGNGFMIDYVKNQTDDICIAALDEDSYSIQFIRNPSQKIKNYIISKKPNTVQYIEDATVEDFLLAVSKDPSCINYIDYNNKELIISCFIVNPMIINYVTDPINFNILSKFREELIAHID